MKSGSWSAYRAAADPEVWHGGTPDEDWTTYTCPYCRGEVATSPQPADKPSGKEA